MRARAGLKRTSRAEVTGRACNRYFGVTLRAIKAGRAPRATLLASIGVVVPSQALESAAGSIPAERPCTAHSTTDYIHWSGRHSTPSAQVTTRALAKLAITCIRNTCAILCGTKRSRIPNNARDQRVGRRGVPAMNVVGSRADSARAPNRFEQNNTSERREKSNRNRQALRGVRKPRGIGKGACRAASRRAGSLGAKVARRANVASDTIERRGRRRSDHAKITRSA